MIVPVYSAGVRMVARRTGSSTWSSRLALGQLGRVVDLELAAVAEIGPIGDGRGGGDEREVELPLEALAHDLHVQEAEEAAPEPEAEGVRRLRLVGEAGVVEPELLQRVTQCGELVAVHRVEAAEHHRLGIAVAGQRLGGRVDGGGDRLTRPRPGHVLDAGDEIAHLSGAELGHRERNRGPDADLLDVVVGAGLHEAQLARRARRCPSMTRMELITPRYWS